MSQRRPSTGTPVNIRPPTRSNTTNNDAGLPASYTPSFTGTATGAAGTTPDLRALRAGYTGTPPPAGMVIPPRPLSSASNPNNRASPSGGMPYGTPSGPGITRPVSSPNTNTGNVVTFAPNPTTIENSPRRFVVPPTAEGVVGGLSATRAAGDVFGTPPALGIVQPATISDLDGLPAEEKAKVLERLLVPPSQRTKLSSGNAGISTPAAAASGSGSAGGSGNGATPAATSRAASIKSSSNGGNGNSGALDSRRSSQTQRPGLREESEAFPIPYDAHGADVTHDIYKWHTEQRRQAGRVRSASFGGGPSQPPHPAFEHIHEPGGFRRNYVLLRANEQGAEEPQILNNFIDFLLLFGHFAGEDLEEEDEDAEKEDEEEAALHESIISAGGVPQDEPTESTSLLRSSTVSRSRSRSRRRRNSIGGQGTATVTQAVLMLLKSFVGTGVLFLGKAFFNGGILFSSVTFVFIAAISLYSFLLLVKTKFIVSGSFGDIGGTLYGPWMRYTILGSIVVSQLGFVGAYTIFVAENLRAFVMGVTDCLKIIPVQYFILIQLIVFLPLALVRDLAKLSSTALIADAFILAGLIYIFGSEFKIIAERGVADVQLFNPKDFPLFIGTAVFSFEGIGLVIPITDAMREPHKFPKALTGVMAFLVVLFGGAGVLAYLTFGSEIQTVVLVNLDTKSQMVQAVQFLYALAILLSIPLQFFPAVRILENGIFTRSGKTDATVKWLKNMFRFAMVLVCTAIAWLGAADLDKFVAFVGCFACVPLCYVYPAMLHLKAVARTRRERLADWAMIVFGMIAFAYTTVQTLKLILEPAPAGPPVGQCES